MVTVVHCQFVRCSLFVVRCRLFVVRCSLFVVRCSLFVVRCSLFVVRYPLFVVRCSLFVVDSLVGWLVGWFAEGCEADNTCMAQEFEARYSHFFLRLIFLRYEPD